MPRITHTRRNIIRRAIIRALKHAGAGLFELATLPLTVRYKGVRWLDPREVQRIVDGLLYEGEIERRGKNRYYLTSFGVTRMLPVIRQELATDGKIRIIVFDVPEAKRSCRDRFRRHIKLLGFKQHQRSVWVSKYRCEDWIKDLMDYHEVGNYVSLFVGSRVW